MAGLSPSPSISPSPTLSAPAPLSASLPQGQTCHVATAHSPPFLSVFSFLFFPSPSSPPRPPWHLAVLRAKRRPYERGHIFIRATCLGLVAKGAIFWCSVKQCVRHESLLLEFLWLFFLNVSQKNVGENAFAVTNPMMNLVEVWRWGSGKTRERYNILLLLVKHSFAVLFSISRR